MDNALGYIRVSTANQVKEGYSLGEQLDEIEKFCKANGFNLVETYRDEGKSGAKTDEDEEKIERDGLLDMLDRVKDGDIKYIVVLSTNRLWRSDIVKMIIRRELKRHKVDIKSIDAPTYSIYTTDPTSKLINVVLEGLDEYERMEIARKLRRGRKKKAEGGGYSGGGAPYGYRAVRGSKILEVVPEEARGVQRVFELAGEYPDMPLRKLASQMVLEGYRGRKGNGFSPMLVKRILDQRTFIGGIIHTGKLRA